jgi:membrane protein DedA with SNARE-associated domain
MYETAIAGYLDQIALIAPVWGLLLIFLFMTVESSFIPFPSEVVMIPAGFLAARGELGCGSAEMQFLLAVAAGVLGSVAGAYVNYVLSLWLGKPFLDRYGKYFFIKKEALDRACEVFNKYGSATTFVCRLIPVIRQLISIPAGISRMPLAPFTFFTALGAGIWSALLAATGYALSRSAGNITYLELVKRGKELVMGNLPLFIGSALALAVAYTLVSRLVMRRR